MCLRYNRPPIPPPLRCLRVTCRQDSEWGTCFNYFISFNNNCEPLWKRKYSLCSWQRKMSSYCNCCCCCLFVCLLERFSFECRKVIGFALSTRCDWLKRFAPPFHPIRSKTKANCDALACIFPRFASATCNYFEF